MRTAMRTGRRKATIGALLLCLTAVGCGVVTSAPRGSGTAGLSHPSPSASTPVAGEPATGRSVPPAPAPRAKARGSEGWRISRPAVDHQIEAFTTATSGLPGTSVGLKVSTTEGGYEVSAYRIGAYEGGTGAFVWESGFRRGRLQRSPVLDPVATRTVVAPWRRSLTVDTEGWRPGFYVFRLRTNTGWETQVPYVVRSETAAGTVALVAPVTTWQAYNSWGGYSLYQGPDGDRRSYAVSFDRPYNGATGANDYRTAAIPIIVRAEETGAPLSYFTNVDLETAGVLRGALGYVSMGHDEYWTPAMRAEVTRARDRGTNLAFLSANTMYWRIRLEARSTGPARLQVGYRDSAVYDPMQDLEPARATARFRDAPAARPEQDVIGMMYECYPVDEDYVMVSPGWWGFHGTGFGRGERVPGLVGPEADRVYPDRTLPRPLQILAHTPYSCRGTMTSAQSVYYSTPSGAGVFSAGTLRWGCALVDRCDRPLGPVTQRFVRIVTGNLVTGFATGPMGAAEPAHDNVTDFDLPVVNSVSAS